MTSNTVIDFGQFKNTVARVVEAGGSVTSEYERLTARLAAYYNAGYSAQEQLTEAVLGDAAPERLGELRALAMAELTGAVNKASVNKEVAAALTPAMRSEYAKTAEANYATMAEKFNAIAKTFTAAAKTIDPETPAEALIHASEAKRRAWTNAGVAAIELTEALPLLMDAARLAGKTLPNNDAALGLVVDTGTLHRRRVWEAWETTEGRCGRWSALHTLGAPIQATPLEEFTLYREPRPIETQYVRGSSGGHRPVQVDPEDVDHEEGLTAEALENKVSRW